MTSTPELIDIGCNLTNKRFRADMPDVIRRARDAGVAQMVVTGTSVAASWSAFEIAKTEPGTLYSTAGVHPHNAKTCNGETLSELRTLAGKDCVMAIGECGLDYDRNFSPPDVQRRWFEAQLELAVELGMPVFLHERKAHDDFVSIMRKHRDALPAAVVHCFTGTGDVLDAYLDLDMHIGITGWICDERRGTGLREIVDRIPPNRLMIETDSPFLLPREPRPRDRRNEPAFLPHVLQHVAECVGRPAATVAEQSTATARAFFGILPEGG